MVKFNKSELKWLIILLGLTYYIYMLLATRRIYYFIHPRMIKYTTISFIFLLLLTLIQFRRLFTISHNRKISFSIFIIPIILGILVNPQGLSGEIAGKKKLTLIENNNVKTTKQNNIPLDTNNTNPLLVITSSNFTHITDDIMYINTNKYIGQKISIKGFVYKDATTSKNEFVVSRLMILCCAADAEITGLLCEFANASSFNTDQWVTVTGTIGKKSHLYSGETQEIPFIEVEKVELTKKPAIPYIYPE